MKEPEHLANVLFQKAFAPFFQDRLPLNLGREIFCTTRKRLNAEGLGDDYHVEEVFSNIVTSSLNYLARHDPSNIQIPRAWFHTVSRHATQKYSIETSKQDSSSLDKILGGATELLDSPFYSQERILSVVRQAIKDLPPRYKEFILLDLLECLPPGEIQKRMGIKSYGYFRVLKHNAFSALREAIRSLVNNGIHSLFE